MNRYFTNISWGGGSTVHSLMRAASKVASTRASLAAIVAAALTVAALVGTMASTATASSGARTSTVGIPSGGWLDVATLPQTLFGPATASDGTYVYTFGGYHFPENVGSTLDTVYRYDPAANSWTTLAPMPQHALIASAVYYPTTNKIYVFGGTTRTPDPIVIYDTTLIYDIASNTWSSGATMPAPRNQMVAAYNPADGKMYLNGGYETSTIDSVQATTWAYDPVANTFTDLAPSPIARGGMAAGIVGGHFLVAGGRTGVPADETLVATWDYDIATNTWSQKQDMAQPTNVPGSAAKLDKPWEFGGSAPTPCKPVPGMNNAASFARVADTRSGDSDPNHSRTMPRWTS